MKKIADREEAEIQANIDVNNKFVENVGKQLIEVEQKNKSIFEAKEVDRMDVLKHMREY